MQEPPPGMVGIPYAQPVSVLGYAVPPVARKPVVVTVLGIIGIVYASLGILGGAVTAFGMFMMRGVMRGLVGNSAGAAAQMEPIWTWGMISALVGALIAVGLLAVAVAFLRLAWWGLRGMVIYAVAALVWQVVKVIVTVAWLIPYQNQQMAMTGPGAPRMMFSHLSTFAWIAVLSAFPIVVLVFCSRAQVREAFTPGGVLQTE